MKNKDFHIRISILHKIMLLISLLVFMAIGTSTYLSVKEESRVMTDALIHTAKHIAIHIASSAESAFASLNWIFVEQTLQDLRKGKNNEVVFAKLVKPDGEVYLADNRSYYGDTVDLSLLFDKETLQKNFIFPENEEKGVLLVHPVLIGKERWYVLLGISLHPVAKNTKAMIIRNMLWGGIILLIAIMLSFFLSKSISSPLIDLAHSARVIAEGNLEQTVSVKSKDEVGLLSHAFNRMIKNLKDASAELEAEEKRSRTLVETASKAKVGIAVIQNDGAQKGIFKYINQHVIDLSGYGREELLKMSIIDIVHPENLEKVWNQFITKPDLQTPYQFSAINKTGKKIPIEISTGTTDFDGRKALVCYVRDITQKLETDKKLKRYSANLEKMVEERTVELKQAIVDLKNTQSQLIQSEKLASIGQLAAGIAHEINTPIQYVGDNTRFLKDAFNDIIILFNKYEQLSEVPGGVTVLEEFMKEIKSAIEEADMNYLKEEIPRAIKQTMEGIERVSVIVRSMKEFSHPGVKEKTSMDINRAIENTVTVSSNEWKYVAEIETDPDPSLPPVHCLPGELNQVFLNMIINAAQAIGDVVNNDPNGKGVIRISTLKDGDYAKISISDTGPGIPEEIQTRIFDPFFTTKEVGKGTGQGLAISRSVIVEKHGGDIGFETKAGKGTTFVIRVPIEKDLA